MIPVTHSSNLIWLVAVMVGSFWNQNPRLHKLPALHPPTAWGITNGECALNPHSSRNTSRLHRLFSQRCLLPQSFQALEVANDHLAMFRSRGNTIYISIPSIRNGKRAATIACLASESGFLLMKEAGGAMGVGNSVASQIFLSY